MALNTFVAEKRLALFEALQAGLDPSEGDYDADLLREARLKGSPQLGATRYSPDRVVVEFIYPDPQGATALVAVSLSVPERIVFLPVPEWVVEAIWQGEVDGSYHFESDARALLQSLEADLAPEANLKWFGPRPAKRRE